MKNLLIGLGSVIVSTIISAILTFMVVTIFKGMYLLLKDIKEIIFPNKSFKKHRDGSKVISLDVYRMDKILNNK